MLVLLGRFRRCVLLACRILQDFRVDVLGWDLNVSDGAAPDEAVLERRELWIFFGVDDLDVEEFDV